MRVGAVEDRDLGARGPLVDQPLDLAGDEAGLGVLDVELADLDRVPWSMSVHSDLGFCPRLLAITALAASRIVCVER